MRFWQHDQQSEYTLTSLPTCPNKWDQLSRQFVQKIAEIAGGRMKLQTDGVRRERPA
jgi:hypothetical protein